MRGHPLIRGHFLITMSNPLHVKEPAIKGHLSCRHGVFVFGIRIRMHTLCIRIRIRIQNSWINLLEVFAFAFEYS